jgi:hypothetical protein
LIPIIQARSASFEVAHLACRGVKTPVFKPEAQAKEHAGIALGSSFACASGFDKRRGGVSPFTNLNTEMRNFKERK